MSLLFEKAIGKFDLSSAALHSPADETFEPVRDDPIPIDGIVEYASYHDQLSHPEKDSWIVIPLHTRNSAELSGEYLAFTEHALHGDVFIYDDGGDYASVDQDTFAVSSLPTGYASGTPITRLTIRRRTSTHPLQSGNHREIRFLTTTTRTPSLTNSSRLSKRRWTPNVMKTERKQPRRRPKHSVPRGSVRFHRLHPFGHPEDGVYRFRIDGGQVDRQHGTHRVVQSEFRIFEGNEVLLHPPNKEHSPDAFPIPATVDAIEGLTVSLAIDWYTIENRSTVGAFLRQKRRDFALTQLLNPVPYERELAAIARVRERDDQRALLTGDTAVTFGDTAGVKSSQQDVELNQEQELAVSCALLADHLFCIHGPPGTGKTRTLVEVVRRSVEAGDDVPVCADSNQAVDNLVAGSSTTTETDDRSLHAHAQHGAGEFVLRRVNASRSSNEVVSTQYATCNGLADVVAATNSSAATLEREFDVLVLDEATQATCTASCIPLARADKVILAGDHKQLPPFSATEEPPESAAGLSLFEHLYADGGIYEGVGVQLRTQYRMHRDIAWFPNSRFYDRALRQGRDVTALEEQPAFVGYDIGGSEATIDHSKRNDAEVRLVAHIVDELLTDADVSPSEVGVITPYTAQANAIRKKQRDILILEETSQSTRSIPSKERKVAIVISLVRSNTTGETGFLRRPLDGPRRLNVAMTRAQRFCAIVGDWYTLRSSADGTDEDAGLYDDLYSFLENTGRLRQVEPEFIPVPATAR